jgi:antitoxin component YwqK of YwqJK toxin-antitoxin module
MGLIERSHEMPAKKSPERKHVVYHKDGSIWAKGKMAYGVPTGYWEWFRKNGTKLRSGYFMNGKQAGEWTTYDKTGKVFKVTVMRANKSKDRSK